MATLKTGAEAKKKYTCARCKKTMSEIKFYNHRDGTKDEYCKDCLCAHINNFDPETFTWILERLDVPYIPQEWNTLRDRKYQEDPHKGMGGSAVMGKYLAKMKLNQWKNKETGQWYTWADSEMLIKTRYGGNTEEDLSEEELEAKQAREEDLKKRLEDGIISEAEYKTLVEPAARLEDEMAAGFTQPVFPDANPTSDFDFDSQYISEDELPDPAADLTTDDKIYLAMKWGRLYKPGEWVELEKKYTEMMDSFDIQDADTRNTLILMCKTDLKMNQALDCGDVDGYQKLARVSDSLRKSGKFTAAQNKDKDNDQIDCTGKLIAVCERIDGFIDEQEIEAPRDIVDKIIQDQNQYVYNLVTKDLGFGQQIENYLKKIQLEHEAQEKPVDEVEEVEDKDIAEYYERIADEKDADAIVDETSNAYVEMQERLNRLEGEQDGIS